MYLRPTATDITYVDEISASTHFGRSVVVVDSPQTTENIIGYVILAIAVGLVLVGFIAAFIIRRCCAYCREMRQHWRRRKARRRITSGSLSSTTPTEKARISTTTVLRADHSEKTDPAFSSLPTNKVFADLPPYNHEHEINHHELSDNHNNGTVSSLVRSPSPVHVNVFNDPHRDSPFQMHGNGMEDSVGFVNDLNTPTGSGSFLLPPVNSSIRPHGIPLTPLPEDASAVFPMPYFEADEQTLFGTIGSESDHDHYPGLDRYS